MLSITLQNGLKRLRKKSFKDVHSDAIECLKMDVDNPIPYFLLGVIASEHNNHIKALELFNKAIELDSECAEFHVYCARTLSAMGRQNGAKLSADKAANFTIKDPHLLDTLGVTYSRSGYHALAIPFFEKAVSCKSDVANFHFNLAASAQFMGDFDKAELAYNNALRLAPNFYRAWTSLISLKKQTEDHNSLTTLIPLFEQAKGNAEGQLQIGHAIAKTLEDLGRYEESLEWLIRGKKPKRNQLRYDRKAGSALFTAAKLTTENKNTSSESSVNDIPIFVFGLPRTGTTLVDRILSSHSDVISVGELNTIAELSKIISRSKSDDVMDAETILKMHQSDVSAIGKAYMENIYARKTGVKHIVDKMPLNFFYAGLIHRALPQARIIALRRDPMDSCLSNFRQLFSTEHSYYNYAFDLDDMAWFYSQFDELMAHWKSELPENRFMEVSYEDIVFDQEKQTRRLLQFCNLDWEEACMQFHENAAPVSTASSVQVRQPLYSGSIGRWKKYGDKLDGLKNALGILLE